MNADTQIRIENLRNLGKTPTELSVSVGSSVPYWSDMIKGRKSFGEKTARKIEAAYGLPRGYMDEPHDRAATPAEPQKTPPEIKALEQLYLAIAPEFRPAAIAAATQAMISFLSSHHTSSERAPGAQEAKPSESPLAAPASNIIP